ncbi:hypothetical protein [Novosphingobium sp. KN65.2]|uniref:hypothetical protein n=1 Tax=Novosphingobium sp. KN65.2 TaxID=1478134 RepID=UPI0005E0F7C9|nr:hypothetical protein [Novosphingobium sp. KN65.2]CDO37634.1 hypothetical protein SPHV1_370021 [Novosphingobium sp. KN65.2]
MTKPFAISTPDPLFDPKQPVTVNGYRYVPDQPSISVLHDGRPRVSAEEAIEIWRLIERLTDGEGDTVNVLCPNPDFNGQPNYAIECNGAWTDWIEMRVAADRQIDCFRKAVAAMEALNG